MRLAERIRHVELSPTLQDQRDALSRMKAQGIDVLDFSVGEPDFDTPPCGEGSRQVRDRPQPHAATPRTKARSSCARRSSTKLKRDNGLDLRDRIRSSSRPAPRRRCTAR